MFAVYRLSQYVCATTALVIIPGVGMQHPSSDATGVVEVALVHDESQTQPAWLVHFWPVGSLGSLYVMCVHGSGGTTLLFGSSVQHVSAAAAVVVVHSGFHSHSACSVQRPSSAAVIGSVAHGWLIHHHDMYNVTIDTISKAGLCAQTRQLFFWFSNGAVHTPP